MKEIPEYEKDLASIRTIMERSAKFISLSGLSGVLAGFYALAGAVAAYFLVQYPISAFRFREYSVNEGNTIYKLIFIATAVLVASIYTGLLLSNKNAQKNGRKLWSPSSRKIFVKK
jgi:predicted lysophospholipase L1 biosynthesis ABC-type transport system permease subunit